MTMTPDLSTDEILHERIRSFISTETRTRKKLSSSTDLALNLGVDGDDALQFMSRFAAAFGVDMSTFNADDYFGAEGFDLIKFVRSRFVGRRGRSSITIAVLVEAAKAHRWPSTP